MSGSLWHNSSLRLGKRLDECGACQSRFFFKILFQTLGNTRAEEKNSQSPFVRIEQGQGSQVTGDRGDRRFAFWWKGSTLERETFPCTEMKIRRRDAPGRDRFGKWPPSFAIWERTF